MLMSALTSFWIEINNKLDQVSCLALNVYHEARGEPFEGQLAVAQVTINRRDHSWFPNSICKVVYQNKQFSWTHVKRDHTPKDIYAWEVANAVAVIAMFDPAASDVTDGALFYHADWVEPSWKDDLQYVTAIGSHIFYQWDGTWK